MEAPDTCRALAEWAVSARPDDAARELARRSLVDTVAVAVAAREHPLAPLGEELGEAGRAAMRAHLLDYDDLHLGSTAHVSVVCVPAALASGGGERAFLAAAGVMARLGEMLGWAHYGAGWHATCTAGAPAAAVAAALARGLDGDGVARAMALAVASAGGVQRAFGTAAKSLQVGFAVDAGLRAAALAAAGADADSSALDQWVGLLGGSPAEVEPAPFVPGGLAVKAFPCCYALQRPIAAMREALAGETPAPDEVEVIRVRAHEDALQPLIHPRPRTGLEAKFSIEYGVVAALLDGRPGLASFTDASVARPQARELVKRVAVETAPGGNGLLAGTVEVEIALAGGDSRAAAVELPPGAPERPLTEAELEAKVADCTDGTDGVAALRWGDGAEPALRLLTRGSRA